MKHVTLSLRITNWTTWILPPGVKRPGREVEHSPPTSDEVTNAWSYTSTSTTRLCGIYRGNFNFTFTIWYASFNINCRLLRKLKKKSKSQSNLSTSHSWSTEVKNETPKITFTVKFHGYLWFPPLLHKINKHRVTDYYNKFYDFLTVNLNSSFAPERSKRPGI